MRFSGILLDLDNTVYPYQSAHAAAMDRVMPYLCQELKRPIEELNDGYDAARSAVKSRLGGFAASHSRFLYFQTLCEGLGVPLSNVAVAAEDLYWKTFFDHMVMRPLCLEFLLAVRPTPVAVVTDLSARLQLEKILRLNLQGYVSALVSSEEAGYEKPHPRIFELAAHKLAADPSTLCMIGDSWERDIEGALQFNMHCYWFRDELVMAETPVKEAISGDLRPGRVRQFCHFSELIDEVASIV